MADKDSGQSKSRLALISEMQKLFVFQLANGAEGEESASLNAASLNVTAAVHPLDHPQWNFSIINITITIFASLVIFCTLSGNALVIVAVIRERRLRKVSNSFIINLAVSDVLVGVLVMPIALLYQLQGRWVFSRHLCHFWVSMDVICCTASITSLCAISYDRYNSITRPLRYARKRTRRRSFYLVVVIWVYSACIAVPPFLGWGEARDEVESKQCKISQHAGYTLYSTIGAFYLPLSFMLFAYVCIYRETSKRTRQWRCGPGSSKMISERNGHGIHVPMASLVEEREPVSSPPPCPLTPMSSRIDGMKSSSWSGAIFRSTPKETCAHIHHHDNAIVEEEERVHIERSSSSDCSLPTTSPTRLHTTALVNGTCRTGLLSAKKLDHPPLRRMYGSFPHTLSRHTSNLPSSDSSTTTSSSEFLPDKGYVKHRFSPAPLRHNTDMALKSRRGFVTQRHSNYGKEGNRNFAEDSFRSVHSAASSPFPKGRYKNHAPLPADRGGVVNQITKRTAGGVVVKTCHKRKLSMSQEKRAAKTLSIVLGCFIVCWLPFFVVALLKPLCVACSWPPAVSDVVLWLGYCNSALNPIIYTFFNKDFRFAFSKLLCCACHLYRCRRRHRRCDNPAFL